MELRVGTINVWGLPKPFADDLSARTQALSRRLQHLELDVLLVQEAWTDEIRDGLAEAAVKAGFYVALASRASGGGLMALSRWPILSNCFDKFHFRGDPERVSQGEYLGAKGFQTFVVDGPEGPFTVVNTHLHARYRKERPLLNSAVRAAQLLQLVGELHFIEGAYVVGGDFNCTVDDPEFRIFQGLTGALEIAAARDDLPTLSRTNYYKRHRSGPDKRIDFVFVRPPKDRVAIRDEASLLFAEPERIRGIDRSLSDHFGVSARVGWRKPDAFASAIGAGRSKRDPEAFALARHLLAVGRKEADRRETMHFQYAGGWVVGAVLAAVLQRDSALGRRRFLRRSAGVLAFASLGPAIGFTTLARVDSDLKRDAFDDAQGVLALLEAASDRHV